MPRRTKTTAARAMGAANTLWFEGGRLCADNTDGIGFQRHLRSSVPGLRSEGEGCLAARCRRRRALRYKCHAAAGAAEVRIFNRTRERADAVAGISAAE